MNRRELELALWHLYACVSSMDVIDEWLSDPAHRPPETTPDGLRRDRCEFEKERDWELNRLVAEADRMYLVK